MVLAQHKQKGWQAHPYLFVFLLTLGVSLLLFLPFLIADQGYFLFYGDFNVQQIPFYQLCHDAIRSGSTAWSHTTDLGANFVGSYSFYLLGSPFFWLTLPFPSGAVPYLMAPLLMLKMACAAAGACLFLRRYVKNPATAVVGGLLYAFCGYSIYNIFFNHFHEAMVAFPLLLWSLDGLVLNKRKGWFALCVFFSCTMNYYFFIGQVVFCVLYWFLRMVTRSYRMTVKEFFWLLGEGVLGVLMALGILLPALYSLLQNSRIHNSFNGWGGLLYSNEQRYVHILQAFFFPPDLPARPNFTPDSNAKWASLGAYLPLFSMTGVIAFLQRKQKHFLRILLPLLFLMAGIPLLNSVFQLFNATYYGRWFYMLSLMFVLATVLSLEHTDTNWPRALRWTGLFTLGIALPIGFMPYKSTENGITTETFGLEAFPSRFWATVAFAVMSLLLLGLLLRYARQKKFFYPLLFTAVSVCSLTYGIFFVASGKLYSHSPQDEIIPYALNQGKDIHLPGNLQSVRSDFYDAMDNQGMFWQIPTIQAFHSIVPASIMEFYPTLGVSRDVASRPSTDPYAIRSFLSVRWLFDYAHDGAYFEESDNTTKMDGWQYYDTQNGYKIYENENFIPMGFSYDHYYTREAYDDASEHTRSLMLLKGLVLEESDQAKLSPYLTPMAEEDAHYTYQAFTEDCKRRSAMSSPDFAYTKDGFTATFHSEKDRVLFFSVPYEGGWSAKVNGKDAEIYKVSVGFMAVVVPKGENEIVFTYHTPWLLPGVLIGSGACLVWCGGMAVVFYRKKQFTMNNA